MSKDSHTRAYIIGYILSLVFTAIPYYLVVAHIIIGSGLLAAILVIAMLQMLVQIIFFLHFGRNPKLYWQIGFFVATFWAVLVVVVGSIVIISHLHANMSAKDVIDKVANDEEVLRVHGVQVGTCPGPTGAIHVIQLKNNAPSPKHTDAKLCDTIIIVNSDNVVRDLDFGPHDKHEAYAGNTGKTLEPGQNMVLRLTEGGTHEFHDHIQDVISGDFTVTP
jgi:cytochrome o ubiquinol oxidase operon protein cyoD